MRTMTIAAIAGLATTGLLLGGCDGENLFEDADVTLVDVPAAFEATELVFENGFGERRDLIADGGSFRLVLDQEAGTFESSLRYDAVSVDVTGTFTIADGEIIFSDDPFEDDDLVLSRSLSYAMVGDVLVMQDPTSVFDVDGDGTTEVASLDLRLEAS